MSAVIEEGPVRVGILGCSDIARRKFIPALQKSAHACLAALASRDLEKAASLAPSTLVELQTYEELVNNPAIDLIYISLPNHLHEQWSIAALEHGKHVICEKPLGLSAASVNRMLEVADKHGRLLFENIMYLQHPQHKTVKSLIAAGRIGRLLSLRSEFAFPGPGVEDFRLDPAMGGGAFHDMNRYPLSAAQFFLGGKKHFFIRGNLEVKNGLTQSLQADSITETGEYLSILTAFGLPYRSFYEIIGERGTIRVERAYTTPVDLANKIFVTVDGRDESIVVPPGDHFMSTIDHVCNLIRSGIGLWDEEHKRARALADLAAMFQDNCIRRICEQECE